MPGSTFGLVAAVVALGSVLATSPSQAADVGASLRFGDFAVAVRSDRGYRGPRRHWDRPLMHRRCVAVARRAGGMGRRIRGIRGVAFGPRSCRRAMRKCWRKLDYRQSFGRNPYASCVVARRFYR